MFQLEGLEGRHFTHNFLIVAASRTSTCFQHMLPKEFHVEVANHR